jgi:hypothetical protein
MALVLRGKFIKKGTCADNERVSNKDDCAADNEMKQLMHAKDTVNTTNKNVGEEHRISMERVTLVAVAVLGTTLQNDAIVIALKYTSSAAVMCLCNTSEFGLWD